jgi:hypothetical protein
MKKSQIEKLKNFFEELNFNVWLFTETKTNGIQSIELEDIVEDGNNIEIHAEIEKWTDGGVYMIACLEPFTAEAFIQYVKGFDVDEEITLHRQDKLYCNNFTHLESVTDFTDFHNHLKEVAEKLTNLE